MHETTTALGTLRRRRGFSAIQLAEAVGVSRQTIYAMEAGTYVPNTAVALKLARALETTVEELFMLAESAPAAQTWTESAVLLPGSPVLQDGQAVQLCRVDKRLIATAPPPTGWFFPATDAVVSRTAVHEGRTQVRKFQEDGDFTNRILVAGCDPGISVLAKHVQPAGIELVLAHGNSSEALRLLKQGCVHIAGTHLRDEASGESNLPEIGRMFPRNAVAVISFAMWEEGIVTARGNPKNVRSIEDFARPDISIVNREEGSGSRALLDLRLKHLRIPDTEVRGYHRLASGHLPAAWQVHSGAVDCCLATSGASRAFGLHFVPLLSERYDLVIRKRHLELPRVQNLLDALSRSGFRRELEGLGGYDTRVTGERVL